ncbi:DUF1127 domain-containing protein [Tropicimonas marinistellae]|uniref:DUF1127 domain-containing protein n=1 Tax=Tropicimonas marinistellae TaxID=1739787 RepID=UPI00082E8797|nr:DUF1127 domain-containing protein [Tropicimonas marinistellae]
MAFHDMTRPANGRLRRAVGTIVGEFFAWRDDAASRRILGRLTDHELHDIGLSRGALDLSKRDHFRSS